MFWDMKISTTYKTSRQATLLIICRKSTDSLNVDKGSSLIIDKRRRKFGAFIRVRAHNVLQEGNIVWLVSDLLRI